MRQNAKNGALSANVAEVGETLVRLKLSVAGRGIKREVARSTMQISGCAAA